VNKNDTYRKIPVNYVNDSDNRSKDDVSPAVTNATYSDSIPPMTVITQRPAVTIHDQQQCY